MSDSLSAFKRPYKTKHSAISEPSPTRTSDKGISSTTYIPAQAAKDTRSADKPFPSRGGRHPTRQLSADASSSSSDYSDDSDEGEATRKDASGAQQGGNPRLRTLSKAGADNRRIAIVQMDASDAHKSGTDSSPANDLRARRGHKSNLSGLALVAPPDAAPKSYTELTPPSTAPITGTSPADNNQLSSAQNETRHHRSASDMPAGSTIKTGKSSSRDTSMGMGSVGTLAQQQQQMQIQMQGSSRPADSHLLSQNGRPKHLAPLGTDNDQQRHMQNMDVFGSGTRSNINRTPSPARSAVSHRTGHSSSAMAAALVSPLPPFTGTSMLSPSSSIDRPTIHTPAIGQGKELHVPVAGPIVVDLESAQSSQPQSHRALSASTSSSWRSDSPTPSHASGSTSTRSHTPSATSSYLHYEPGLHATAGPLPPPPRATFNIPVSSPPPPRPPRLHSPVPTSSRTRGDIEAVKQALQLPPSVAATLASRSSSSSLASSRRSSKIVEEEKTPTKKMVDADIVSSEVERRPSHRREAATSEIDDTPLSPPATTHSTSPSPLVNVVSDVETANTDKLLVEEPPVVTVVEPPSRSESLTEAKLSPAEQQLKPAEQEDKPDVAKFDQWLRDNPHLTAPLEGSSRESSLEKSRRESHERPLSPISPEVTGEAPSPPPKSFRNSLSLSMKRFSSLPRTPSISSKSGRRISSDSNRFSSRTPSPTRLMSPPPSSSSARPTTPRKHISTNPAALFCHEVYSQNTTLQRCAIYAGKINELYNHDCGLSEWIIEMKTKGPNTQTQRGPSTRPFTPKPRLTSRSSMASEATFPTRPDATVATDLSQGAYRDITPPGLPPTLPYPSLALNPPPRNQPSRSNSSAGSTGTPPSSVRSLAPVPSTKGAGFFASLGRKASMSGNKPKFIPTISAPVSGPTRSGSTNSSMTVSSARTLGSAGSVPSGPRAAPPRRAQRSQTFMASVTPPAGQDALGRRPSLFNLTLDAVPDTTPPAVDSEFSSQVDRLHALLPHANRQVLAGYLKRAGQDMLAIGQYLEDERMGTIRQF